MKSLAPCYTKRLKALVPCYDQCMKAPFTPSIDLPKGLKHHLLLPSISSIMCKQCISYTLSDRASKIKNAKNACFKFLLNLKNINKIAVSYSPRWKRCDKKTETIKQFDWTKYKLDEISSFITGMVGHDRHGTGRLHIKLNPGGTALIHCVSVSTKH